MGLIPPEALIGINPKSISPATKVSKRILMLTMETITQTVNEENRLRALHEYGVLDTPSEKAFDDLCRLASQICQTPLAMVNFVDRKRVWFKSSHGLTVNEVPRDQCLCTFTISIAGPYIVEDTFKDHLLRTLPMVIGQPHIRFYAGIPLVTPEGHCIGTLSVLDTVPRRLSDDQTSALKMLSNQVMAQLELKKSLNRLHSINSELEKERNKLQLITKHLGDVVWLSEPQKQKMLYISEAYDQIWERPGKELYYNPMAFLEAIVEEDRSRVMSAFPKQLIGEYNETYRIRTPAGKIKWIHDRAFPIFDEERNAYCVVGLASDITEQKLQEELIKDQQLRIIASSKLSALGEMAAGIAHEINNPLTVLVVNNERLKAMAMNQFIDHEGAVKICEKMESTLDRIAKIVRGLKTLSREGSIDPFTRVNLHELIQETLSFCESRFRDHDIKLIVDPICTDLFLYCRSVQLSQVILNLLCNAFDAIQDQQDKWVRLTVKDLNEDILISVTDSGKGIPLELHEKVMQPFYTTKAPGKGTGLGLSLSHNFIASHQGTLKIDRDSANTCFVIKLPKLQAVAADEN